MIEHPTEARKGFMCHSLTFWDHDELRSRVQELEGEFLTSSVQEQSMHALPSLSDSELIDIDTALASAFLTNIILLPKGYTGFEDVRTATRFERPGSVVSMQPVEINSFTELLEFEDLTKYGDTLVVAEMITKGHEGPQTWLAKDIVFLPDHRPVLQRLKDTAGKDTSADAILGVWGHEAMRD